MKCSKILILKLGTRVTLENFNEWKRKYDEETGKAKVKLLEQNKKPTGNQLLNLNINKIYFKIIFNHI